MPMDRVVRPWGGLVSLLLMPLKVRLLASFAVLLGLGVCAAVPARAQNPSTQNPPAGARNSGSSSSQTQPVQSNAQGPDAQVPNYGVYVPLDPLARVRYDNRYDLSLGMAYDHMKAGPTQLQGANLGGLDMDGSFWLTKHWGLQGSGRAYIGTSGAAPNAPYNIKGPVVKQYFFVGGVEWLGPHNKHGAFIAHAMVGGAYGKFEQDLRGASPSVVGFFNDQVALAAVIGGHIDLNRSPQWVFRITPDALYTRYGINYGTQAVYPEWNFGLSVGVEYKFKKKR